MSKEDSVPGPASGPASGPSGPAGAAAPPTAGGLLSKVVRFVRNPSVDWTELDALEDARESQHGKQALKEMLERKRRNDFVRRREFEQLRKLRRHAAAHGQQRREDPAAAAAARASSFPDSMASPGERAVTLKKIDEIEAQMSQQWWKNEPAVAAGAAAQAAAGASPASSNLPAAPATQPGQAAHAHAPAAPVGLHAQPQTGAAAPLSAPAHPPAPAFVPAPSSVVTPAAPLSAPPVRASAHAAAHRASVHAPAPPLFTGDSLIRVAAGAAGAPLRAQNNPAHPVYPDHQQPQRMAPPPVFPDPPAPEPEPPFVHEPDLEEAAIRFAHGDHAGAESGLLEVLAQHRQDAPAQQFEIWMTLFDLYRATGLHERFDTLAIDFAACYGRSAPLWFSIPGQLGIAAPDDAAPPDAPAIVMRRDFSWGTQPTLAVSSVAALQASIERAAAPWTLNWARIANIDPAALPLLADLFTRWADREGHFIFAGVEKLNALLESRTRSGDRSHSPDWWRLRMAALRLMGRGDDFELVALDYCVTYEVSPPSWQEPLCAYSDNAGVSSGSGNSGPVPLAPASDYPPSQPAEPASAQAPETARLSGLIDGDATPLLEPFEPLLRPGVPLQIACDQLIRMDFAAAGSLLNWAAGLQEQGHAVQFHNLQRLVAIFFNVLGISEHARVVPRKD